MTIPHSAAPAEWGMPFGMISSKPHTKILKLPLRHMAQGEFHTI